MAEILDIKLDSDGDIALTSVGDFSLVNSVIQKIEVRLKWIKEEWQWDETLGIPYFDYLGKKNPDISILEEEIRDTIFEIDEITEVPEVTIRIDKNTRSAYISFIAKTDTETYRKEIAING